MFFFDEVIGVDVAGFGVVDFDVDEVDLVFAVWNVSWVDFYEDFYAVFEAET